LVCPSVLLLFECPGSRRAGTVRTVPSPNTCRCRLQGAQQQGGGGGAAGGACGAQGGEEGVGRAVEEHHAQGHRPRTHGAGRGGPHRQLCSGCRRHCGGREPRSGRCRGDVLTRVCGCGGAAQQWHGIYKRGGASGWWTGVGSASEADRGEVDGQGRERSVSGRGGGHGDSCTTGQFEQREAVNPGMASGAPHSVVCEAVWVPYDWHAWQGGEAIAPPGPWSCAAAAKPDGAFPFAY
jgi:hypothetical protein